MQIPHRQPARALSCAGVYLLAVTIIAGLLQLRAPGTLGAVLTAIISMGLLVPLAVVLPSPRPERAPTDSRPILTRD